MNTDAERFPGSLVRMRSDLCTCFKCFCARLLTIARCLRSYFIARYFTDLLYTRYLAFRSFAWDDNCGNDSGPGSKHACWDNGWDDGCGDDGGPGDKRARFMAVLSLQTEIGLLLLSVAHIVTATELLLSVALLVCGYAGTAHAH